MAPLAAYAGSWGTDSPSPNIDQEGRWKRKDRRLLARNQSSVPAPAVSRTGGERFGTSGSDVGRFTCAGHKFPRLKLHAP